jgi:hypothetical protein
MARTGPIVSLFGHLPPPVHVQAKQTNMSISSAVVCAVTFDSDFWHSGLVGSGQKSSALTVSYLPIYMARFIDIKVRRDEDLEVVYPDCGKCGKGCIYFVRWNHLIGRRRRAIVSLEAFR